MKAATLLKRLGITLALLLIGMSLILPIALERAACHEGQSDLYDACARGFWGEEKVD